MTTVSGSAAGQFVAMVAQSHGFATTSSSPASDTTPANGQLSEKPKTVMPELRRKRKNTREKQRRAELKTQIDTMRGLLLELTGHRYQQRYDVLKASVDLLHSQPPYCNVDLQKATMGDPELQEAVKRVTSSSAALPGLLDEAESKVAEFGKDSARQVKDPSSLRLARRMRKNNREKKQRMFERIQFGLLRRLLGVPMRNDKHAVLNAAVLAFRTIHARLKPSVAFPLTLAAAAAAVNTGVETDSKVAAVNNDSTTVSADSSTEPNKASAFSKPASTAATVTPQVATQSAHAGLNALATPVPLFPHGQTVIPRLVGTAGQPIEVEKILDRKVYQIAPEPVILYLVSWKNLPSIYNSWEPALMVPAALVQEYEKLHGSIPSSAFVGGTTTGVVGVKHERDAEAKDENSQAKRVKPESPSTSPATASSAGTSNTEHKHEEASDNLSDAAAATTATATAAATPMGSPPLHSHPMRSLLQAMFPNSPLAMASPRASKVPPLKGSKSTAGQIPTSTGPLQWNKAAVVSTVEAASAAK